MQKTHEQYMDRALQLARAGAGRTAPNPMVGAVLVFEGRIIGEGYHAAYGLPHAEVRCLQSVPESASHLIAQATLYVTLEPCAHYGKTPPCADLIIAHHIPRVVIGSTDPFPAVCGRGIKKLQAAGIEVITGIQEAACQALNKRFFTFHQKKRPFILLKWAQSPDGFMALPNNQPVRISAAITDRIVHKWRREEAAILVGAPTVVADNPRLTNRLWTGPSPLRLVIDRPNRLPGNVHLLTDEEPTWIFNTVYSKEDGNKVWIKLPEEAVLSNLLTHLYQHDINSLMVEGGPRLLQAFIDQGLWDEARVITGQTLLYNGLQGPHLKEQICTSAESFAGDGITYYQKR